MINILVTAVGGTIGLSICKAIRQSSLRIRIIGIDMDPLAAGLFLCDKGYVVPAVKDPGCFSKILDILKKEDIKGVMVSSDKELEFFAKNKKRFESLTSARIIISSPRVISVGNDKWKTYRFLKDNGILCPETALAGDAAAARHLAAKFGFPLIIKPRFASGSYNMHQIDNAEELEVFRKRVADAVIQQFIPLGDGEFTAAVFCDGANKVLGSIVMKRELHHGTTFRAESVWNKKYYNYAEKIVRCLKPVGPCNIQFRASGDGIYALEINTRFSSTSCIRAMLGFNDVEMAIKTFILGKKIDSVNLKKGVVLRYWNEIFLKGKDMKSLRMVGKAGGKS